MARTRNHRARVPLRFDRLEDRRLLATAFSASWVGQGSYDFTGSGPSIGPDGIEDIQFQLSGIPYALSNSSGSQINVLNGFVIVSLTQGGTTTNWESGINLDGYTNAEVTNVHPMPSDTTVGTANLYINPPASGVSSGATFEIQLYSNTSNSSSPPLATVYVSSTTTVNGTAAMPAVTLAAPTESQFLVGNWGTQYSAQASQYPGYVPITLPSGDYSSVTGAVLSDEAGAEWAFGNLPNSGYSDYWSGDLVPFNLPLVPENNTITSGVLLFPPVRDETNSYLTLTLYNSTSAAPLSIVRIQGGKADPTWTDLSSPPQPAPSTTGTPTAVHDAASLIAALNAKAGLIQMSSGTYDFALPLNLDYPVTINGAPGVSWVFNPTSSTQWGAGTASNYVSPSDKGFQGGVSGAVVIEASHVTLNGFQVVLQSYPSNWAAQDAQEASVIYFQGYTDDSKITNMSLVGDTSEVPYSTDIHYRTRAITLIETNNTQYVSGQITGDTLLGGNVEVDGGPWIIENNDFQGPPTNYWSVGLSFASTHDLVVEHNHFHTLDFNYQNPLSGASMLRMVEFGGSHGSDSGFNDTIADNTADQGVGFFSVQGTTFPGIDPNSPEAAIFEGYTVFFEGVPSAVSSDGGDNSKFMGDGWEISIPFLMSGSFPRTGDIVAVLDGPYAGRTFPIAQLLPSQGNNQYTFLLDTPLPISPGQSFPYDISITRGYVDETFANNRIDLSSLPGAGGADDCLALQDLFDSQFLNNTLIGGAGVVFGSTGNNADITQFTSASDPQLPEGQWATHVPTFNVTIQGNTIENPMNTTTAGGFASLRVAHTAPNGNGDYGNQKSSHGRLYLTASFLDNTLEWSSNPAPPQGALVVNIGVPGFTTAAYSWVDPSEMRLNFAGNSAVGPDATWIKSDGSLLSASVYAATIPDAPTSQGMVGQGSIPIGPNQFVLGSTTQIGNFVPDALYVTQSPSQTNDYPPVPQGIDTSQVTDPAPASVYYYERYGTYTENFKYLAPDGTYVVRLHFSEDFWSSAGARLVTVAINGNTVLNDFDVYLAAGDKQYTAVIREFTVKADANGQITINFSSSRNGATCSAIQLIPVSDPPAQIAIDTGGSQTIGDYLADTDYTQAAGQSNSTPNTILTGAVTDPAPQSVYQTSRYGAFVYSIPNLVPFQDYEVRLHYALVTEQDHIVDRFINGVQLLPGFDVGAAAQAAYGSKNEYYSAVVESITMAADASGTMTISLPNGTWGAFCNAIQIIPVTPGSVLINAGGSTAGAFGPDADSTGGNTGPRPDPVTTTGVNNPAPQAVYDSERYGTFTYAIPGLIPGGAYLVRLDTSEHNNSVPNQRHTTVAINGYQVLTNFDTYAAAGGEFNAVAEQFQATADNSGTITIAFTSNLDGAQVDGIEVYPTQPVPPTGLPFIADPSFEQIQVGSGNSAYSYNPMGSAWSFTPQINNSGSGISGNGSGFTASNTPAPLGAQVAFLQSTGAITQMVQGWSPGTYALRFYAAQRANNNGSNEDFQVLVNGSVVGTFQPSAGTGYTLYQTSSFTIPQGVYAAAITFQGLDSVGGDNTALLDGLGLLQQSSSSSPSAQPAMMTASGGTTSTSTALAVAPSGSGTASPSGSIGGTAAGPQPASGSSPTGGSPPGGDPARGNVPVPPIVVLPGSGTGSNPFEVLPAAGGLGQLDPVLVDNLIAARGTTPDSTDPKPLGDEVPMIRRTRLIPWIGD